MRVEVRLRIVGEGGEVICDDVNVLAIQTPRPTRGDRPLAR